MNKLYIALTQSCQYSFVFLFLLFTISSNSLFGQCDNTVLNFNEDSDQIVVSDFPVLNDFTIMMWFRSDVDNFESYEPRLIILSDFGPGRSNSRLEFGLEKTSNDRGKLWIYDSKGIGTESWGDDLRDDTWHHLAFTKSYTTRNIYLDGELLHTWTGDNSVHGTTVTIGDFFVPINNADWKGSMDDIRIYDIPMTQEEITDIGFCNTLVLDPNLVAAWTFEDGVPNDDNTNLQTITDVSGNGHHGQLIGFELDGDNSNFVCPIRDFQNNLAGCCDDLDGDGFFATWCGGNDCDDNDATIFPGALVDSSDEWIESIKINGFENFSGVDGGYGDYTQSSMIDLTIGEEHEIVLDPGYATTASKMFWRIYIDFDQDGVFDHGGERELQANGSYTLFESLDIPANANPGITKMRIIASKGGYKLPCSSDFEGEIEDYTIQLNVCDPLIDGGIIGNGQAICPNNNDPSTISNINSASGGTGPIEYQWLMNTSMCELPEEGNSNNWTEIAQANDVFYDPGPLSASTLFLRAAKNQGCTTYSYSNIIEVVNTIDCSPDCASSADPSPDYWIKRVKFGSMANNSSDDGGYADNTNMTSSVTQGKKVTYQVRPGFSSPGNTMYWRVWADWNQDGFYSDLCELIFEGSATNTVNGNYYIPTDAMEGNTTLRVAMKLGAYPDPCETGFEGEVEDYSVMVNPDLNALYAFDSPDNEVHTGEIQQEIELEHIKIAKEAGFQFYPNPASEVLHIELPSSNSGDKLFIHDALGKLIYSNNNLTQDDLRINIKEYNFNQGIFFVSFESEGTKISKKLIIN